MANGIRTDRPRSYRSIEQSAARIRSVLMPGITVTDDLPCLTLFERLDQFVVSGPDGRNIPLTYGVQEFPTGVDGLTRYDDEGQRIIVSLSTTMYEMLEMSRPRAKFALAHEIGHAALHPTELVRLAEIPHGDLGLYRRQNGEHASYIDSEWQANGFGAALLMPAAGLAELERQRIVLTPAVLQETFGVSAQAANIRLDVFRKRRTELL